MNAIYRTSKVGIILALLFILSISSGGESVSAQGEAVFLFAFGVRGTADGAFLAPREVDVNGDGQIVVLDWGHRVQTFDANGNFLKKIGIGSPSCQVGRFHFADGMTVDDSNNIYVANTNCTRIDKFDSDGTFLFNFGSAGSGYGQFGNPWGVAVDGAGNIWVSESNTCRIQKFDPNGNFLLKAGSCGTGDGQFGGFNPSGIGALDIEVDSIGNVYVVDPGNHRVQKFDSNGNFLLKFGQLGGNVGELFGPMGIGIDNSDNIFVADTRNNRIQKFDGNGNIVLTFGSAGSNIGQFTSPWDVGLDKTGRIYVADAGNDRIQVFGEGSSTDPGLVIFPDHGGNAGNVTATVLGTNFPDDPALVSLTPIDQPNAGTPEIVGFQTEKLGSSSFVTTFDLLGQLPGNYDLNVEFKNGEVISFSNAFRVVEGGGGDLQVTIMIQP